MKILNSRGVKRPNGVAAGAGDRSARSRSRSLSSAAHGSSRTDGRGRYSAAERRSFPLQRYRRTTRLCPSNQPTGDGLEREGTSYSRIAILGRCEPRSRRHHHDERPRSPARSPPTLNSSSSQWSNRRSDSNRRLWLHKRRASLLRLRFQQ